MSFKGEKGTMFQKKEKGRTECPFRVCETVKRPSSDALRKPVLGNEQKIGGACPLCAAKLSGGKHGKNEDCRDEST